MAPSTTLGELMTLAIQETIQALELRTQTAFPIFHQAEALRTMAVIAIIDAGLTTPLLDLPLEQVSSAVALARQLGPTLEFRCTDVVRHRDEVTI